MMTPTTRLLASGLLCLTVFSSVHALEWDPNTATAGAQGGSGTWDTTSSFWWNGASNVTWPDNATTDATFGGATGSVEVGGLLTAQDVDLLDGYQLRVRFGQNDRLAVHGDLLGGEIWTDSAKINRYSTGLENVGVHFFGGGTNTVTTDFTLNNLFSSPVVGVWDGTTVQFSGYLQGDDGQVFTHLVLRNGGTFVVEAGAELDFVLDENYFTRQLWVYGDGTGTLEIAPGFSAITSSGPDFDLGIASYRLSNATIITHETQGLPVGNRPNGSGGIQRNGHFVFENEGGSTWIVRSNPQSYDGAVWIGVDMTVQTEEDLTHSGITNFSSHFGSYWADNAFQTTSDNVTVTKTGPATLTLLEETAWRPGAVLSVEEGAVIFAKDPAAGIRKGGGGSQEGGPNLTLEIRNEATVRLAAPLSRIESVDNFEGRLEILGTLELVDFTQNDMQNLPDSFPPPTPNPLPGYLAVTLDDGQFGQLIVSGTANVGGRLEVNAPDGFSPPVGTTFDILVGSYSGDFHALHDFSGLGVEVEYLADRIRLTTTRPQGTTGVVIDEDFRKGYYCLDGWQEISIGEIREIPNRSDIPYAFARRMTTSFVWDQVKIDLPTFRASEEDVIVMRFETFSDVAHQSDEWLKPEVAALHNDARWSFGHDHALEVAHHYATFSIAKQLFPNVENGLSNGVPGAFHSGGHNSTRLETIDESVTVFRPNGNNTNVEAFGRNASRDSFSQTAAQNGFEDEILKFYDNILLSIPRGQNDRSNPVYRTGESFDTGLVGITQVHVGITHRTDANLDYVTDALDFILWNSYAGSSGTHQQTGDINNDGQTNASDWALLELMLGVQHDWRGFVESQSKFDFDNLPNSSGKDVPAFSYDALTGILTVTPGNEPLTAAAVDIGVATPSGIGASLNADWWKSEVGGRGAQVVDTSLTGMGGSFVLAQLPTGLGASDFGDAYFGFASGGGGATDVTITGKSLVSYADWVATNGLSGVNALGETVVGPGNLPNLIRFALGYNAQEATQGGAIEYVAEDCGTFFQLRFTRPNDRTGETLHAEISTDGVNYDRDPSRVELMIVGNGDGTEDIIIRVAKPVRTFDEDGLARLFVRLAAE